jgi:hypothetical protein
MLNSQGGAVDGYLEVKIELYRSLCSGIQAEMRLPWGDRVTQVLGPPPYDYLREATLGIGAGPRSSVMYYGKVLSEWLFQGRLREAYRQARTMAAGSSPAKGLRFGVGFEPQMADILALRWECLYDTEIDQYLSLAGPFVRYLLGSSSLLPAVSWPLRVLVAVANPPGPDAFHPKEIDQFKRAVLAEGASGLDDLLTFAVWERAAPDLDDLGRLQVPEGPVHAVVLLARSTGGPEPAVLLRNGPVPWDQAVEALLAGLGPPPSLAYLALPGPPAPKEPTHECTRQPDARLQRHQRGNRRVPAAPYAGGERRRPRRQGAG